MTVAPLGAMNLCCMIGGGRAAVVCRPQDNAAYVHKKTVVSQVATWITTAV